MRIIERLIEKEAAAHQNLGDVAWLMGLHEAEKEEDKIAEGLKVSLIFFDPGARNKFHTHTFEQVLWVTSGRGILATKEEEHVLTPGMIAYIPPGELHWHGAAGDSAFAHISFATAGQTTF